jgi:hypothetical protein
MPENVSPAVACGEGAIHTYRMPIETFPNNKSLDYIKWNDNTTRSNLQANPLTSSLAEAFADFMAQRWQPTYLKELSLEYALSLASARAAYAHGVLNGLVKKLDGALFVVTKNRGSLLYQQYFGAKRPHEVIDMRLEAQVEVMRGFIASLQASKVTALAALGDEIKTAVEAAETAVKGRDDAQSTLRTFRLTGERAQLVADYNALRKKTYGELGKIRHEHPELPNDFAETFFHHRKRTTEETLSPEEMSTKIEELKAQQAALEEQRAAAIAEQKHQEEEAAKLAQKQAALEEKKKEKEALEAEIKKMESEIKH